MFDVIRKPEERAPLPAISLVAAGPTLTALANDYGYDQVFARQVYALGTPADCLLAFTTSGSSPNVIKAIEAAHEQGMRVIALTGRDGGAVSEALTDRDLELCVPSNRTARIQEVHQLLIHCFCDGIDRR